MREVVSQVESKQGAAKAHAEPDNHATTEGVRDIATGLLDMQRTHGNRYVNRLLNTGLLQAKLTVSDPGDQCERQADRVAEVSERTYESHVYRACAQCEEQPQRQAEGKETAQLQALKEEEKTTAYQDEVVLRRSEAASGLEVSGDWEARLQALRGGGRPLDGEARSTMESAFGEDFGGVRIHTNPEADVLNVALSARAFTTGQDIFFRHGEYDSKSSAGQELLAHELTHVIQQSGSVQYKLTISQPEDEDEREADRMARAVVQRMQGATGTRPDEESARKPIDAEGNGARRKARLWTKSEGSGARPFCPECEEALQHEAKQDGKPETGGPLQRKPISNRISRMPIPQRLRRRYPQLDVAAADQYFASLRIEVSPAESNLALGLFEDSLMHFHVGRVPPPPLRFGSAVDMGSSEPLVICNWTGVFDPDQRPVSQSYYLDESWHIRVPISKAGQYQVGLRLIDPQGDEWRPQLSLNVGVRSARSGRVPTQSLRGQEATIRQALVTTGTVLINEWQQNSSVAVHNYHPPTDDNQNVYFLIALAGNLVWAATAFGVTGLALHAMSVGGAMVGSGVVERIMRDPTESDAAGTLTEAVDQVLASQAGQIEEGLAPTINQVVAEVIEHDVSDASERQRILWERIFPRLTNSQNRRLEIQQVVTQALESIWPTYLRNYRIWRQEISDCSQHRLFGTPGGEREMASVTRPAAPVMTKRAPEIQRFILPIIMTPTDPACIRSNPFTGTRAFRGVTLQSLQGSAGRR